MTDHEVIRAWIVAHLDEDEAAARATTPVPVAGRWRAARDKHAKSDAPLSLIQGLDEFSPDSEDYFSGLPVIAFSAEWQEDAEANLRYIALHDPARSLREVEAKRRRLDRHAPLVAARSWPPMCSSCEVPWPCLDIVDDAQAWADDPTMPEALRLA